MHAPDTSQPKSKAWILWAVGALVVVVLVIIFLMWPNDEDDVVEHDPVDGSTPTLDEQGHVSKELGQPGRLYDADDNIVFEIEIVDAQYLDTCPSRISEAELPPEREQFLAVTLEAELSEELPAELELGEFEDFMPLMPENFAAYDTEQQSIEGIESTTAFECFTDDELLPSFVSSGEQAQGIVVFDVDQEIETLSYLLNDNPGWSWTISAIADFPN